MALLPRGEPSGSTQNPRQPTSLQGLLRFSMEATKAEDAPPASELHPMDEDRKKFLEAALSSMSIDVVALLQEQIKKLKLIEYASDDEIPNCLTAIDTILDYVDNIDIANDFHKIGGFMILNPCLKCKNPNIRAGVCELIAVLCQNNPYCQRIILDNNFIPILLKLVEKDDDIKVITKAVYAISCVVRDNADGISQFVDNNGLPVMLKCLKGTNDNVIMKCCFLLTSVCKSTPEVKDKLINLGFVHQLLTLFMMDRCPSHEFVLSLLVAVLEERPAAVKECKNFRYNVKDILIRYMNSVKNKDYFEEEEYCRRILHMLNSYR